MAYFRYKRQMICAPEVDAKVARESCDIMVLDKTGYSWDIEVKISKSDLWNGEAKKNKHSIYKDAETSKHIMPNYFYICVPTILIPEAIKWVETTNSKYGILEYIPNELPGSTRYSLWEDAISVKKQTKILHKRITTKWHDILLRRLSSALATIYQDNYKYGKTNL